jgi:DNA-binding MurR/RpiR family transcriptional regulator
VSRFVARLGYESYPAFQRALRADIGARMMTPVEVYRQHAGGAAPDVAADALGGLVAEAVRGLSAGDLERATGCLADPRRPVTSTGGWFSQLAAAHLCALLREFRPRVRHLPPIAADRVAAIADANRHDVLVVFDFRRYERVTRDFATAMHDAGATVVLVTDPWLSPVADLAHAVLTAGVSGPAPFESLVPTLAVVETLAGAVAAALGDAGARRFEEFGRVADRWVEARA